jgi:phage repressor protein C with HTH and peptisase S24 domain
MLNISNRANWQERKCKVPFVSVIANFGDMDDHARDTNMLKDLVAFTKKAPSKIAKEVGVTPTTILRPFNGTASTVLSRKTYDKLRARYPDFPGWFNLEPDQTHNDPSGGRPQEIGYIKRVDVRYAMGTGAAVEEFPSTELVPFNLSFIRSLTRTNFDSLFLASGFGDSMEPTLLRSDLLLIDAADNQMELGDQIWCLTYMGAGMVKRLRKARVGGEPGYLILSDNPSVPPQEALYDDVHIIGRVIWAGRTI